MVNILIVDDSEEVRENLSRLISTIDGLNIIGKAENHSDAVMLFEKHKPYIVILDIDLGLENGIEILKHIKHLYPATIVIMLTNYSNSGFKLSTEKLGADYFLDKSLDLERLINILMNIARQK